MYSACSPVQHSRNCVLIMREGCEQKPGHVWSDWVQQTGTSIKTGNICAKILNLMALGEGLNTTVGDSSVHNGWWIAVSQQPFSQVRKSHWIGWLHCAKGDASLQAKNIFLSVFYNNTTCYSDYLVSVIDYWKMSMEYWWKDSERGKHGLSEKPIPIPLCPSHISHWLAWDQTQPSKIRGTYHYQLWSYITVNP